MCKKENPIPGKIIAVTNRSLCERPFLEQIKRVCETKPAALILREKDLPETEYEEMARQVLAICEEYGVISKEGADDILLPAIKDCVKQVDIEGGTMQVHLLDGLRDLNSRREEA